MKTYRVEDILTNFGIFINEEYEAENLSDAIEQCYEEICENLGNYIDIEMKEVTEEEKE